MDWELSEAVIILDINDDKDRSGQAMFSCIVKHEITDCPESGRELTERCWADVV